MEINVRAVSSVGRASRLHRLSPLLFSLDKSYLIYLQPLSVTLTSPFVTKTERIKYLRALTEGARLDLLAEIVN